MLSWVGNNSAKLKLDHGSPDVSCWYAGDSWLMTRGVITAATQPYPCMTLAYSGNSKHGRACTAFLRVLSCCMFADLWTAGPC